MKNYRKFLVALGGAFSVLGASLADGSVNATEFSSVVLAFVSAGLVFAVANIPADEDKA